MTDRFASRQPDDQLLGEIPTEMVVADLDLLVRPGEKVYIEPGSAGDCPDFCHKRNGTVPFAPDGADSGSRTSPAAAESARPLRVENGDGELLGHLSRELAEWLWPLLASGKIRLEGYVPVATVPAHEESPRRLAIVLTVYQTAGRNLLSPIEPADEPQQAHELVRQIYAAAHRHLQPEIVVRLADWLGRLPRAGLLPETHLLFALLPGLVHEMQACDRLGAIVELRRALAAVSIGAPQAFGNLTLFSLAWLEEMPPPWRLLDAALAGDEATLEENPPASDGQPVFRVANRAASPVLVLDGQIIGGAHARGVISGTLLAGPQTTLQLPLCSREQWRPCRAPRNDSPAPATAAASSQFDAPPIHSVLDVAVSGVAAAAGPRILGIDLFGCPDAFRAAWPTIAGAYEQCTASLAAPAGTLSPGDVRALLERVGGVARARWPAVGIGCEIEIADDDIAGRALLHGGRLAHLAAFVREEK